MQSRGQIHGDFVARFHHTGTRPSRVSIEELDGVEAALNCRLPVAYREFITRHGTIHTPAILDELSENEIDHADINYFLHPREVIEGTRGYWSAGMPDDIIGFASDCMGNMIGFHRQSATRDDAPVVFFDHDFVEVSELARTFDEFLGWYLDHLKGQQSPETNAGVTP